MSLSGPRGMLMDAKTQYFREWARVREVWDDRNAEAFEQKYVSPVESHVRMATEAMEKLSAITERARRACE